MLTQKVDKKKNMLYLLVFITIIIIIAYLFLKDRIKHESGEPEEYVNQTADMLNLESSKKLDASFLESRSFRELKDNRAREKALNEINVGKQNPFAE